MKRKKTTIAIVPLVLMLAVSMLIAIVPYTSAQDGKLMSWAYVAASPKISALHEQVLISMWTSPLPGLPATAGTPESRFKTGYELTFTKPDSTTDIVPMGTSFEDGTLFYLYTPDMTGTWSVVLYWPGNNEFEASTSPPYEFEVGDESPYTKTPLTPIPTEYWRRPVDGTIRGVSEYLASWTQPNYDAAYSNWNPYTEGPTSAHILWSHQSFDSGILGGEWGDLSGPHAYTIWRNTGIIVMMGRVYENIGPVTYCYDAYTGELLWSRDFGIATVETTGGDVAAPTVNVRYGLMPDNTSTPIYRGVFPVIYIDTGWGEVQIYNGINGELLTGQLPLFRVAKVTDDRIGISALHGGDIYYTGQGHLLKWDPYVPGLDLNASSTFTTLVNTPKMTYRMPLPEGVPTSSLYWEDIGVASGARAAYNLTTGALMWDKSGTSDVIAGVEIPRTTGNDPYHEGAHCVGYGKYFIQVHPLRRTVAFDLYTGELAWVSEPREYPFGSFTAYQMGTGNGKVYVLAYDGYVYAYDADDGTLVWKFYSGDAGLDTGRGTWPWWANPAITSDKVYASTGEHTFTNPRYIGNRMYCIDDTTGTEIWNIAGSWGGKSVAENKLFAYSDYSGEMYCFGRGPTATTVSAPENVVSKGTQVLIKGSVTDESPITKNDEVAIRFPEGVPAVSEDTMSKWMEYLYMQRPIPDNIEGVTVKLTAIDPNGNTHDIGTVTTDSAGMFKKMWMPPVEGEYTVYATFEGSTSYWSSKAQTVFGIGPAPSTGGQIEPEPGAPLISIEVTVIATVALVAVASVGLYWFLRKR